MTIFIKMSLTALTLCAATLVSQPSNADTRINGTHFQGTGYNGSTLQGTRYQGTTYQGTSYNGPFSQGTSNNAISAGLDGEVIAIELPAAGAETSR